MPRFTLCDGPRTDDGRINLHDLARYQPVEQVPDRGKALLDGRRGPLAAQLLDIGGDMQRLHVGDRRDAGAFAPGQKFPHRLRIGAARVPIADIGREEFPETRLGVVAGGRNDRGGLSSRGGAGSEMVHESKHPEMFDQNAADQSSQRHRASDRRSTRSLRKIIAQTFQIEFHET